MAGENGGPGNPPTPRPKPPASRSGSFRAGNVNPYQYTDKDFSYILKKIGAPVTPQNLTVMRAWRKAEGGTYEHNPFNTTQPWKGAQGSFVKRYADRTSGLEATADTLLNAGGRSGGKGYYSDVLQGFRTSNPEQTIQAIVQSPWAAGGYGGKSDWKSSTLYGAYTGRRSKASASAMTMPQSMPGLTGVSSKTTSTVGNVTTSALGPTNPNLRKTQ